MTASITYDLNNLPTGFIYNLSQNSLYSPVSKQFAALNKEGTVTSEAVTFLSVDHFVSSHLYMLGATYKQMKGQEAELNQYKMINLGCGHHVLIKPNTFMGVLVVLSIALLAIVALGLCCIFLKNNTSNLGNP